MLLKLVREMNEISFFNSHVVSQTLCSSFFLHLECFKRYFNNDNHGTKDGAPSEVEPISRFPCCHVPGIQGWDLPSNSFLASDGSRHH